MINLPDGLNITVREPVDSRIILTKEQMRTKTKSAMPDNYFCICSDDNRIYIWDVTNPKSSEYGYYRPYEETIDLVTALEAAGDKQELSKVLVDSLRNSIKADSGLIIDAENNLKLNLNENHLGIVDNKVSLNLNMIQAVM